MTDNNRHDPAVLALNASAARESTPEGAPFRAPHYTCSAKGCCEEVALAASGTLYLDDVESFARLTIELVCIEIRERLGKGLPVPSRVIVSLCPPGDGAEPRRVGRWEEAVAQLQSACKPTPAPDPLGTATYDPADDKLRFTPFTRLSEQDYATAKQVGLRWAPRQELFFVHWNPSARDLLERWCGEITDEDTTLAERAQERAERFEGYSIKREAEGDAYQAHAASLADNIPLGQPILVGHHSQRRAERDAKRIDDGIRRAVKMWETAEYWQNRARGVVASANYKDRADVRARRIKKLEAEVRKRRAEFEPQTHIRGLRDPFPMVAWQSETGEPEPHVMTGQGRAKRPTPVRLLPAIEERERPWIEHLSMRIDYERAILAEQGATEMLEKPKRAKLAPLLNVRAPGGLQAINRYRSDAVETMPQIEMTKAEWKAIHADYKGSRYTPGKAWRFRTTIDRKSHGLVAVFLSDSKEHQMPEGDPS